MADEKQNFYVENKDVINPIVQMGISFFMEWLSVRRAKKQVLRISQTLCGKCPATTCKLIGRKVTIKDIEKCYDDVLTAQMPPMFSYPK